MKVRTTITLPQGLLRAIDEHARQQGKTRSQFIEGALQAFVKPLAREAQNAWDLEIINRNADFLNREASDVLEYLLR